MRVGITVTVIITIIRMIDIAQLQLWRLISPMLPIGAYAYSTGLEYAIEIGWIKNEADAYDWISGVLTHNIANTDIPVMIRCYQAWQTNDTTKLTNWNNRLLAMRESRELLLEDTQLGRSLAKVLVDLNVPNAMQWFATPRQSFAASYALACSHWNISVTSAAYGMAFAWVENQVAAAMKLIPLGQSAGQRIISRLLNDVANAAATGLAIDDDEAIGVSSPALAIGSARHELQYSRLFRS